MSGKVYRNSEFGDGYGPIIYNYVRCVGYEDTFYECYKHSYKSVRCYGRTVGGVICIDGKYTLSMLKKHLSLILP